MSDCESCGGTRFSPRHVDGVDLLECDLCGTLQGDTKVIERLTREGEALERGYQPLVYPLVQALEAVPAFRVEAASAGRLDGTEYPYVFLRLAPDGLRDLERLLTSLEMANRHTKRRWVVETALQRGLLFIVRPRFWKSIQAIDRSDIEEARADLAHLAEAIGRDSQLGWWRE